MEDIGIVKWSVLLYWQIVGFQFIYSWFILFLRQRSSHERRTKGLSYLENSVVLTNLLFLLPSVTKSRMGRTVCVPFSSQQSKRFPATKVSFNFSQLYCSLPTSYTSIFSGIQLQSLYMREVTFTLSIFLYNCFRTLQSIWGYYSFFDVSKGNKLIICGINTLRHPLIYILTKCWPERVGHEFPSFCG